MHCLSCGNEVRAREARLWQSRLYLCSTCATLADKAKAELDAAHRRAELQAMMFLEQRILAGGLLATHSGMELPGLGAPNE